jgi:alkylated DNA nucleotide flippase Atl1
VPAPPWACPFISLPASQGVTTKATASEMNMPIDELIGIGLMYGPIRPLTKAIGSSAAITVKVARMVGPPTSSTAFGISCHSGLSGSRVPAVDVLDHHDGVVHQDADREDQREQLTRLSVKPQAQEANSVAASVRVTAAPTITASRRPRAKNTSSTTAEVAKTSLPISLSAFSVAVAP